jgi:hypothetical protein
LGARAELLLKTRSDSKTAHTQILPKKDIWAERKNGPVKNQAGLIRPEILINLRNPSLESHVQ